MYDKIDMKKKALAHNLKVIDKGRLVNMGELIFTDSTQEQYANRAFPYNLLMLAMMLNDENKRVEAVNHLRNRYFMAGILYAVENPDVKELLRPASERTEDNVKEEIKNMEYEKEARIQKKPSYG